MVVLSSSGPLRTSFGSAPNFQGGLITLCTCKHRMRTYHDACSWEKYWIVGFTGKHETQGRGNGLFYFMKVGEAYDSHAKLWQKLPEEVRRVKAATCSKFGDVFEPRAGAGVFDPLAQFNPGSYRDPIHDHVHADCWKNDVNYRVLGKCRLDDILEPKVEGASPSVLLVGDPDMSFLWSRPLAFYEKHPRTKKWDRPDSLGGLLSALTC